MQGKSVAHCLHTISIIELPSRSSGVSNGGTGATNGNKLKRRKAYYTRQRSDITVSERLALYFLTLGRREEEAIVVVLPPSVRPHVPLVDLSCQHVVRHMS